MALIEVVFYALNESIQMIVFRINDVGGSIVIHTFGAYFGLAVAWMCTPSDIAAREADNACTPVSDLFSMIGTVFLWMYWPSFNAAIALPGATQVCARGREMRVDCATRQCPNFCSIVISVSTKTRNIFRG